MDLIVKCKISNHNYVANQNYKYEPIKSGIFNMLQVFAGSGDEDDDELFYPSEMEKFFFWVEETDMPKVTSNTTPPPRTSTNRTVPPLEPETKYKESPTKIIDPHTKKKYDDIMEKIKAREEQIKTYPNDPEIEGWKTELESYKGVAKKLKVKLDG